MKILRQFIREKLKAILLYLSMFLMISVVMYLYDISLEAVSYAMILCTIVAVTVWIVEFSKFYVKHRTLIKHTELEEVYMLDMPLAESVIECDYQRLVNKLIVEKSQLASEKLKLMTEMSDYYTMWAHQIKTPISAMNLLLQEIDNNAQEDYQVDNLAEYDECENYTRQLKQELFKIDFYVDAVLQYLRLEDMSSDFKFDTYLLDKIVRQSVKKFAAQFIHRKIKIELDILEVLVLTDEKWLAFVIEQVLSNAIKYTNQGGLVKIYMQKSYNRNDKILIIEDNGIGIREEDLPRIFERGFTGYNGRMDKKSTGIGLYLCKKATNKLSHTIRIESKVDVGTKVMVDMSSNQMRHE